jgi:serine/threonine-protein kinase
MSASSAPRPNIDPNLLLGLLAFAKGYISRKTLLAAVTAWAADKAKPLGKILVEQHGLGVDQRDLLDEMVPKYFEQHGPDPRKIVAAVGPIGSVLAELQHVPHLDLPAMGPGDHLVEGSCTPWETVNVDALRPDPLDPAEALGLRFRILRPLAKGNLGEVFVAHDEELHREVALKEIQERHADDPDSRARFLLEAEVTGRLEHPGIVPVYGLGRYQDGRPFYAMRLIQGKTLKEAIDRFHEAEGPNRNAGERSLALRELLGQFIAVCNAVAYSHSRGILHRDLKPANIMLGKFGETLVVDWGLAKSIGSREMRSRSGEKALVPMLGESTPTVAGQTLGTPGFMSPEQAAGQLEQLGPASDVYNLGATFYYLLTGKIAHHGPDLETIREKIQRGDFPAPRLANRLVSPALEAICLKAMALAPADRYVTPKALAEDLEHWLADEPVGAWREPWNIVVRRWLARHRTLVTAASATVLVAVLSLLAATVLLTAAHERERRAKDLALAREQEAREQRTEAERQRDEAKKQKAKAEENFLLAQAREQEAREQRKEAEEQRDEAKKQKAKAEENFLLAQAREQEAREQRKEAEKQRDEAKKQKTKAEDSFRLARKTVDRYHTEVSEDVLLNEPGMEPLRRKLLEAAREFYQKFTEERQDDPGLRADLGKALYRVGRITADIGDKSHAIDWLLQAQRTFVALAAGQPAGAELRSDLANCDDLLGRLYRITKDRPRAERSYQQALDLWEGLAKEHPKTADFQAGLARSLVGLGNVYAESDDAKSAWGPYRRALDLRRKLVREQPSVAPWQRDLAMSYANLASLYYQTGETDEAVQSYREAEKLQKDLADDNPRLSQYQNDLAQTAYNLGNVYAQTAQIDPAVESYGEALTIWEQLTLLHPTVTDFQAKRAEALYNLGYVQGRAKKTVEAKDSYAKALAIQQKLAEEHPDVPVYEERLARIHFNMGIYVYEANDRRAEANAAFEKARAIWEELASEHPKSLSIQRDLGRLYHQLGLFHDKGGDSDQARADLRRALALWQKLVQADPEDIESAARLGGVYSSIDTLFGDAAELPDILDWYGRIIKVLERPTADRRSQTERKTALRNIYWKRAEALARVNRNTEALRDWDHVLALETDGDRAWFRLSRALTLARLGQRKAATAEVAELSGKVRIADDLLYLTAQVYAVSSASAQKDDNLGPADRRKFADQYADRAIDALTRAGAAGFFQSRDNLERLKKDPAFERLRSRKDFKDWLNRQNSK